MPQVFRRWPDQLNLRNGSQAFEAYSNGYRGAVKDPEADEQLNDSLEFYSYADVCDSYGMYTTDTQGLFLPFLANIICEANRLGIRGTPAELSRNSQINPWPESQTTGDCVSHYVRNQADNARAVDIVYRREPEQWHSRCATENIYGDRGHSGAGANCSRLVSYVTSKGGLLLRKKYQVDGFGELDLSEYKASIGIRWGSRGVPATVNAEGKKHQILQATRISSVEEAVQAFANGLSAGGCSGIGISRQRSEFGVSSLSGGWAHAMWCSAMDARPKIVAKYGGRLFLIQNSWGKWNSGGRRIEGTEIDIPHGSCWLREKDFARQVRSGGSFTMAGAVGWQARPLVDFGTDYLGGW